MKTLYLDIFSGISGDMFIGAMLDLGVNTQKFEHELEKLGLHEYHLHVARQERGAIAGTKFDVHLAHGHEHEHAHVHAHEHSHGDVTHSHEHAHHHSHEHGNEKHNGHEHAHEHGAEHHDHLAGQTHGPHGGPLVETKYGRVELSVFETNVPPRFRLYFFDQDGHEMKPPRAEVKLKTIRDGKSKQEFRFVRRGDYLEASDELPEPHEFVATLKIKTAQSSEKHEVRFVEDHHHGEPHAHSHSHEHREHTHGRTFGDSSLA